MNMKDQGHKKHGDRTEIIETTTYPEKSVEINPNIQNQTRTVTSGSMPVTYDEPHIVSSTPIYVTNQGSHLSWEEPHLPQQSQPLSQTIQLGQESQHPGTTVKTIIDKTTIEHHGDKEEGAKKKVKHDADKILGFIPNSFSKKEEAATTEELERAKMDTTDLGTEGKLGQNAPITTTTTTTFKNNKDSPSTTTTTTKQVTEYPTSGTTQLKCDKSS